MLNTNKTSLELFQLTEFLEMYLPVLNYKTPTRINGGGCGIFAKHLNKTLKDMGFDSEVVYIVDEENKKEFDYLMKNNAIKPVHHRDGRGIPADFPYPEMLEKHSVGVVHCLTRISEYIYFDSEGVQINPTCVAKAKKENVGVLPLNVLDILIDNKDSWNPIFDRDCEGMIVDELNKMPELFEKFKVEPFTMELVDGVKFTAYTRNALKRDQQMKAMAKMMGMH